MIRYVRQFRASTELQFTILKQESDHLVRWDIEGEGSEFDDIEEFNYWFSTLDVNPFQLELEYDN